MAVDKQKSILVTLIIAFLFVVIGLIIASVAEATVKSNQNKIKKVATSVKSENGFDGSIENQSLQITTSINGIIKGKAPSITETTSNDITSSKLIGFNANAASGMLTAEQTILRALEILNANINAFDIGTANGFTGTNIGSSFELSLAISEFGLLATDGLGKIQPAVSTNVTSALLTGLVSVAPGIVSPSDSILSAIQKLIANIGVTTANIIAGHGYQGSTGPSLSIQTNVTGILKGDAVTGDTSAATASDVTGQSIAGYSPVVGTIADTDSILIGINKLSGNYAALNIISTNGFGGTFSTSTNAITLTTSVVPGFVKSSGTSLQSANATDINGQALTGLVNGHTEVKASNTILQGIGMANGNHLGINIKFNNGFGGSFNAPTNQLTITTTFSSGIAKFASSALTQASDIDITSQALTGYSSNPGTITTADTIITGIGKLNANQSKSVFGQASTTSRGVVISATGISSALTGSGLSGTLIFPANSITTSSTLRVSATFSIVRLSGTGNTLSIGLFETQHNKSLCTVGGILPDSALFVQFTSEVTFRNGTDTFATTTMVPPAQAPSVTVIDNLINTFNTGVQNTIDLQVTNNNPPGRMTIQLRSATFGLFNA